MEFQPWYLQARAKLQVDCTHISQRNKFFYIHSKLKDKIFNQVQTWVKVMTERETFSVQGFFNQLIIVYDNFQSMEITVKELNKMKQGNKQSFSAFISGFEKNMLETGGWSSTTRPQKHISITPSIMRCIRPSSVCLSPQRTPRIAPCSME